MFNGRFTEHALLRILLKLKYVMSQYAVVVIRQRRRQKTEGTDDVPGSHFHANEGRCVIPTNLVGRLDCVTTSLLSGRAV